MNKTKLTSWGNNREKEVVFTDIPEHGTINVGNQNSYGDCFFPKNANAFKNRELQDINYKFNSSMTMDDLITKNRIGLYGVPGKRNVTLGGAIASDTHGKDNIWGGSFARNIKDIYIQLPNNEKLVDTALRECSEELGIQIVNKNLFPLTPLYIPPSNFLVSPFVTFENFNPKFNLDKREVAAHIQIPLFKLMELNIEKRHLEQGIQIGTEVPCFYYEKNLIWGATAMILAEFKSFLTSLSSN